MELAAYGNDQTLDPGFVQGGESTSVSGLAYYMDILMAGNILPTTPYNTAATTSQISSLQNYEKSQLCFRFTMPLNTEFGVFKDFEMKLRIELGMHIRARYH